MSFLYLYPTVWTLLFRPYVYLYRTFCYSVLSSFIPVYVFTLTGNIGKLVSCTLNFTLLDCHIVV